MRRSFDSILGAILAVVSCGGALAAPDQRVERVEVEYVLQDDDGLVVRSTRRIRAETAQGAAMLREHALRYVAPEEDVDIEFSCLIKADGRRLERAPSTAEDRPIGPASIPEGTPHLRIVRMPIPDVEVGDALEIRTRRARKSPGPGGAAWVVHVLEAERPVDEERVSLSMPTERPFTIAQDPSIPFRESIDGPRRTISWSVPAREARPATGEPRRALFVASTLHDVEALGRWYRTLTAEVKPDSDVTAKATLLVRGLESPTERVRVLFDFVSKQIRTEESAPEVPAAPPQAPGRTLKKGSGDARDKDALLRALLHAASVDSSPVLIPGALAGVAPPTAPGQIEHVMSVARSGGETLWLDPSLEMATVGDVPPRFAGRRVVVAASSGAFLAELPRTNPEGEFRRVTMSGTVDAIGRATVSTRLEFKSPSLTGAAVNAEELSSVRETLGPVVAVAWNREATSPAELVAIAASPERADMVRAEFRDVLSDYIPTVRTLIEKPLPSPLIGLPVEVALSDANAMDGESMFDAPLVELEERLDLEVDSSFSLQLPAPLRVARSGLFYESTYALEGGTLRARRLLRARRIEGDPKRVDTLRAFFSLVAKDTEQRVAWRRSKAPDLGRIAADAGPKELVTMARAALKDQRAAPARDLFLGAIAKDPSSAEAWEGLGFAYVRLDDHAKARSALERAAAIDPDRPRVHLFLAYLAKQRGDKATQVAELQKYVAIEPFDGEAFRDLGWALDALGRKAEAIDAHARALELMPADVGLRESLASSLARAGRRADAVARLEEGLAMGIPPEERIAVAGIFAREGIDAERGAQIAIEAVKDLGAQLDAVTIDAVPASYGTSLRSLASGLDILASRSEMAGRYDEAKALLEAMLILDPQDETAKHLYRVHLKRGDQDAAFKAIGRTWVNRGGLAQKWVPKELEAYVAKNLPSETLLKVALQAASRARIDDRAIRPAEGKFAFPAAVTGPMSVEVLVVARVRRNGTVESAKPGSQGKEPFVSAALKDVRRMKFPTIDLPDGSMSSIRTIRLHYSPSGEVSASWYFP